MSGPMGRSRAHRARLALIVIASLSGKFFHDLSVAMASLSAPLRSTRFWSIPHTIDQSVKLDKALSSAQVRFDINYLRSFVRSLARPSGSRRYWAPLFCARRPLFRRRRRRRGAVLCANIIGHLREYVNISGPNEPRSAANQSRAHEKAIWRRLAGFRLSAAAAARLLAKRQQQSSRRSSSRPRAEEDSDH